MADKQEDNADENIGKFRRHDLIVSIILWAICFVVFLESIRMTFGISLPGIEDNVWLVAPGFFPMILSAGLLLMASALLGVGLKQGDLKGHFSFLAIKQAVANREKASTLIQMALLCLFVFGLLGRVHFGVAAALYLFCAMAVAGAAKLWQIILISLLFAGGVTFLFGTLMKIPLP